VTSVGSWDPYSQGPLRPIPDALWNYDVHCTVIVVVFGWSHRWAVAWNAGGGVKFLEELSSDPSSYWYA
jgi:hypothetical protein